jgi:uncharacterized membrane protein YbhN (UPF0104 family)
VLLRVSATAAGLILLARGVDLGAVERALASASPFWLLAGVALTGLTLVGAAVQWGLLLRGHAAVPWARLAPTYAR